MSQEIRIRCVSEGKRKNLIITDAKKVTPYGRFFNLVSPSEIIVDVNMNEAIVLGDGWVSYYNEHDPDTERLIEICRKHL